VKFHEKRDWAEVIVVLNITSAGRVVGHQGVLNRTGLSIDVKDDKNKK